MKPISQINAIRSNDVNTLSYRITITQGSEIIKTEEALLNEIKDSIPFKKGVLDVKKISDSIWEIKTNK